MKTTEDQETEPAIAIHIVETTDYYRTVSVTELERLAGITLAECEGNVEALIGHMPMEDSDEFHERVKKWGDIRSQDWTYTPTTLPAWQDWD